MATKHTATANELEEIIINDGSLEKDPKKKMLFKSYAVMFSDDLVANLDLTSIELDEKYMTNNPVSWRRFLNHPSVKRFVDEFLNERAEKQAMKQIGEGYQKTTDALKVKEMVDSKKEKDDNSHIVVVFMPQKKYNGLD
jgi:hypothetical protein